jgi:hypothetical protein
MGKSNENLMRMQKSAFLLHFFTKIFGYIKKKQYLCTGFGNSPCRNYLIYLEYGKEKSICMPLLREVVHGLCNAAP